MIDSCVGVETPEGISFLLYPAGWPARACAWAIDVFIQGVIMTAFIIFINIIDQVLGVYVFFLLSFVLTWFYHVLFEVFGRGRSPGKRILGIRVVRSDGSPVDPGASFLRNLLRFADGFLFLYLFGFLCINFSRSFKRLGDFAAGTLVVYTARSRLPGKFSLPSLARQQSMAWLRDVPPAFPSRPLSYGEKQGLLSFARRYPVLGKNRADEIAQEWAASLGCGEGDSAALFLLGAARMIGGVSPESGAGEGDKTA